ncbi:MAG: endonuclease/exonuclease/phosphatase family protein [Candidatus Lokiarchaeota archaeon]|nr:endonuclease/exonuclease/phosphatase family protein [Candidatus Lokiarchaeota archaeon]
MKRNKKKIKLIVLFFVPLLTSFVMIGLGELPRAVPQKTDIKFMTYNIHFGQGMDDLLNMERIAQNILTEDPDIIGLQEVENGRITSQGIDMAFWLAKRLNMHYFYYPAVNNHAFGVAILSKFPIKSASGTQIPALLQERVLLHAIIELSSSLDIDVFVTHLGIREENNSAQVDYVLEAIRAQTHARPKVLMGDFNLNQSTEEIQRISNNSLINMTNTGAPYDTGEYTFPSYPPDAISEGVIDYIFATNCTIVGGRGRIIDSFVPGNTAAEFGSDHRPYVATLRFK